MSVVQYILNKETFEQVIEGCKEYLEDEIDVVQQNEYNKELDYILEDENMNTRWSRLLGSGIFHDAYGEVVEVDTLSVYVETDY